jgi:LuxR family maltose regulon positive regulatory protein
MSEQPVLSASETSTIDIRLPGEDATALAQAPLIVTKTRIPRRRPDILPRQRLVNFLHAHLDRKLILISAPAGYGKSSLLADFAHDTDLPVCWYTLDPFDQDLHTFLDYLIAAIALRFPAFGQRSRALLREVADPGNNLYPIVASMVQEIYDAIPEYFVLILDDHHAVENQDQINEFIDLFVAYADENCHLILASRTLPALPNLSLLVARRQAAGLSLDELRFTPHEIQRLAEQNYGLNLTPEQAGVLAQRTGGWITGILLTAVPRWQQAEQDIPLRGRIGVDLYDYLSKQVLDQQPAPLRDFLMASSVLDELSPELCTAVLGLDNPASSINQVRARNLFVIEYEDGVNHMRYHDLFHDFLQTSLRRQDETRFRELTRRAARVYASRGEWERAVSRFVLLQEYEPIAEIINGTATYLYDAGRWDTLARWIDVLPPALLDSRPHFMVQRGKIHMERGEHASALAHLNGAEAAYMSVGDSGAAAHVLATKGSLLRYQGRYSEAIKQCKQAIALVDGDTPKDKTALALAYKSIGLCQLRMGALAQGQETLRKALHLFEELQTPYDVGMVHHDLGLSHELAGDLAGAVDHYRSALDLWQQLGNLGPWANTLNGLGVVYYQQGQYGTALPTLNEALTRAQQAGDLRVEAYVWASLGDLYRALGAYVRAQEAYLQALDVARRTQVGFIVTYALDGLGNALRQQGNLIQAREELQKALVQAQEHKSTYEIGLCHTSLGILAAEEGDPLAARHYLDRAVKLLEAGGFQQDLSRARLHRAQAAFQAGEWEQAHVDLEQALAIAEHLGSDQYLVVTGQQVQPLLHHAAETKAGSERLTPLLERIQAHQSFVAAQPKPVIQAESDLALRIYAFGNPQVEVDGRSARWIVSKSRDLFFCLLQYPTGLTKEQIGNRLWPEHEPESLNSAFRSTLYRLRRILFKGSVVFEDGLYFFNRASEYWLDVEVFEQLLDRAEQSATPEESITLLEQASSLYRSDYLEGVDYDWADLERKRLQGRYMAGLETLAELYADQRRLRHAIEVYERLLRLAPHQEIAHRELMRCHFRRGDRAAAIRQYHACVEALREDLGLSPSPETETLYLEIIG